MFYPRFEFILLQNVQSIRECEPQRLGHIDVRPHYVRVCRHLLVVLVVLKMDVKLQPTSLLVVLV